MIFFDATSSLTPRRKFLERKGKELKEKEVKQTYRENLRKVIKLPHDSDTSQQRIQPSTRKEAKEGEAHGRKKK